MSASVPRLMAGVALLTALVASAASSFAQIPAASSARSIPTEFEQTENRVTQIIAKSDDHFRKGKLNLEDNKIKEKFLTSNKPLLKHEMNLQRKSVKDTQNKIFNNFFHYYLISTILIEFVKV